MLVNQVATQNHNTLRLKVLCAGPTMAAADDYDGERMSDIDRNGQSSGNDVMQYFYLKNIGTLDLVLDVKGMNRHAGSPVILWDRKYSTNPTMLLNQLWYEDTATSTIRTALNDFCLDLYGKSHRFHI